MKITTGRAAVVILLLLGACRPGNPGGMREDGYLPAAAGASLYYRVLGSGPDTVVAVHGGPGAGMNSFPSVKRLANQYTVLLYDQRGGGRSTLPTDTTRLRPKYFVEDLEAVRRHFGLDEMNVIAHSFGSVLVARYATEYPDHLGRVVFHGATGPSRRQAVKIMKDKAAAAPASPDTALSNRASDLLQDLLRGTASNPVETCREYEAINRKIAAMRGDPQYDGTTCSGPPEAVRYYYRYTAQLAPRYFGDWDFTTGLGGVSAPLLVVYGANDSLAAPAQRAWASAVANGRLLLVPNAGKGALADNPEVTVPAIARFFNGSWPDDAKATTD